MRGENCIKYHKIEALMLFCQNCPVILYYFQYDFLKCLDFWTENEWQVILVHLLYYGCFLSCLCIMMMKKFIDCSRYGITLGFCN